MADASPDNAEPVETGTTTNEVDQPATAPVMIEDDESSAPARDEDGDSDDRRTATTGQSADAGPRSTVQTIKDEAGKFGQQASEGARSFFDDSKHKASGALDDLSRMMHDAAGQVDEKLGQHYGQYARSSADAVSGFAEKLRSKQVDELVDEARDFVRASPAVAIGAAAAIGFVVARLARSGVDAAVSSSSQGRDQA